MSNDATSSPAFTLRAVLMDDAEALRGIYNHAVRHTTATMDVDDRTLETQAAWIDLHDGTHFPGIVAVATEGNEVIGYGSLSPLNPKPGYSRSVENSIYVHPAWHGRGVGRALLTELIAEAEQRGFVNIVALISGDNVASLSLHRALGFVDAGVLRRAGFKHGSWVDVVYLQCLLESDT